MNAFPEGERRRQNATALGYQSLAADLLRDREPAEDDLTLLCMALADAALAGDRNLLERVDEVVDRLDRYLPEAPWANEWRGRLWTLRHLALGAWALLEVERRSAQEEAG